jgi:FkbM family methyltransferase
MFNPLVFSETFLSDIHFSDFNLENEIVIQAGGFIGDTALYYANRGAKVYSFEPDINSFNLALENIKLNPEFSKRIVMKNYAIGNDETIEFPINPNGSGGSSAYDLNGKKTIKVKSASIKTILEEFSIDNPYLLDLDIKGKEFEIINDKSISKFKMIRIEYSTSIDGKKIGEREQLIEKLKEYGFNKIRIFKHNGGRYDLMDHGTIEAVK